MRLHSLEAIHDDFWLRFPGVLLCSRSPRPWMWGTFYDAGNLAGLFPGPVCWVLPWSLTAFTTPPSFFLCHICLGMNGPGRSTIWTKYNLPFVGPPCSPVPLTTLLFFFAGSVLARHRRLGPRATPQKVALPRPSSRPLEQPPPGLTEAGRSHPLACFL